MSIEWYITNSLLKPKLVLDNDTSSINSQWMLSTDTNGNMTFATDSPIPLIPSWTVNKYGFIGRTVNIQPLHPSLNLNEDATIQLKIVKYFMYKTLDDWLWDDLIDILGYLRVDSNGVHLVDSVDKKTSVDKDSDSDLKKKVDYINEHYLTIQSTYKILKKYTEETKTNWYDLYKNKMFIKDMVKIYLKKKLREAIQKKK